MQRSKGAMLVFWKILCIIGLLALTSLQIMLESSEESLVLGVWLVELTIVDSLIVPLFLACSLSLQKQDVRRTVPYISADPKKHQVICGI